MELNPLHQPIQRRNFQRLHKLAVESLLPAAPLMSSPGEPAQCIDSRLLEAAEGTQAVADGVAIQSRHLDIEENDIRVTLTSDAQRFRAIATNMYFVPSQLQQFAQ